MKWFKLLILLYAFKLQAQQPVKNTSVVDSLIFWVNTHPKVDSLYIHTLHRISYRLSEIDIKKSFEYYVKVSSLSDSLHFVYGKALAEINLGLLLAQAGNYQASNSAFFKAINEADSCHDLRLKAISYNNIGENFESLKYYSRCRKYINLALVINIKLNSLPSIATNYELLARCDFDETSYSNASIDLLKGMLYATKLNSSYFLSKYYLGFAKWAAINNKIDSANFFFAKALKEAQVQNDPENEYQVYLTQAQYLKTLTSTEKILLLNSALNSANQTSNLKHIANAAKLLSSIYDTLSNKKLSQYYYRIYTTTTDSIFSIKNELNVIIEGSDWIINRNNIATINFENRAKLQLKEIAIKNILLLASIICILLGLIAAIFIYKSIQSKKKRQELILKQTIAEGEAHSLRTQIDQLLKLQQIRTQISRDLHDDIGSSLSSIMVMSELAKKRKGDTENYFDKIKENAGNIMENMSDIVWAVNPGNDTIEQMFVRMQSFASSLLEKKDIAFQFMTSISLESVKLTMEERKNFYLIFKEAIHNSFKYSFCSKVATKINQHGKSISMNIQDNGKGFDPAIKYTGNGIKNMVKRAKDINGKLEIFSTDGKGTSITLVFMPTQTGS